MSENKNEEIEKVETEYNWTRNKNGGRGGLVRNFIKFGPNEKCPCDSGLKFKKCCKGKTEYYLK